MKYADEQVSGVRSWQLDALKVQLAFTTKLGVTPSWTEHDVDMLEEYANALMRATSQPNGGQRRETRDEAGEFVSFNEIPTIMNALAVLSVKQVLAGAHRKERGK